MSAAAFNANSGERAYYNEPLVLGSAVAPQSFTSFILPFFYELSEVTDSSAKTSLRYVRDSRTNRSPSDAERRRYFTAETSRALFDNSLSLVLQTDGSDWWRTATIRTTPDSKGGMRQLQVGVEPPEVILFEASPPDSSSPSACTLDPYDRSLSIGFLVLTVHPIAPADENRAPEDSSPAQRGAADPPPQTGPTVADMLVLNERLRYLRPDHSYWWGTTAQPKDARAQIGATESPEQMSFWEQLLRDYGLLSPSLQDDGTGEALFVGWRCLLDVPCALNNRLFRLVDPALHQRTWEYLGGRWKSSGPTLTHEHGWLAEPDHRAFTWTCLVTKSTKGETQEPFANFAQFSPWRRLLNVDAPPKPGEPPESEFNVEWTKSHTLPRWAAGGSYHGFCGHGGATMLRDSSSDTDHIPGIVRLVYRDLVLLLLFDRCVAFALSDELSRSAPARRTPSSPATGQVIELVRRERELLGVFDYFSNVYRFPLLSSQQQAIELYSLARRAMDVDDLVNDIELQVKATDDYLRAVEAQEMAKRQEELTRAQVMLAESAEKLAVVGSVFAAASLAATFAGWSEDPVKLKPLAIAGIGLIIIAVVVPLWMLTSMPSHTSVGTARRKRVSANP